MNGFLSFCSYYKALDLFGVETCKLGTDKLQLLWAGEIELDIFELTPLRVRRVLMGMKCGI